MLLIQEIPVLVPVKCKICNEVKPRFQFLSFSSTTCKSCHNAEKRRKNKKLGADIRFQWPNRTFKKRR